MKMKINKNEIYNNLEKRNKINISESKIKINKEENIKEFIGNNSKKILNNTLHDFIKDENYTTLKNDLFKNEIFYFASFINSCKKYDNIKELKKDIKNFFRNKNENIEYHYHILNNFTNQILNLISSPDFFNEKENIKSLIKILKRFDKNLNSNNSSNNIKYFDIKKIVIAQYKSILDLFYKNNQLEHISKLIEQLTNNVISIENNLSGHKQSIIINKQNKNLLINNALKEKENNNLNSKIMLKGKNDKKDNNNLCETQIILNKKEKKLYVINNKKKYNYENIMFPPIQNSDDSSYK